MSNGIAHWTTDHEQIRRWVEQRGGRAATTAAPEHQRPGALRIAFPERDRGDERLEPISWDAFFERFEDEQLAFTYHEQHGAADGGRSARLIPR